MHGNSNKFRVGKSAPCSGLGLRRGKRWRLVVIDLKSCFPRFNSLFGLLVGPGGICGLELLSSFFLNQFAQLSRQHK
jgi:hypothetical protein